MTMLVDLSIKVEKAVTVNTEKQQQKNTTHKPVIICGLCGAKENYIDDRKTECPNCDDYIY